MNAVIVEIKNQNAAALCDDGCIVKIKNKKYAIGQVIEMKKVTTHKSKKLAILAVSAALFVMTCGTGVYAYTTPYSYVSLDVNPSIEYTLNAFDRVLSVEAVNEDGQEILDKIDADTLKNQSIEDAVTQTVSELSENNYFDGETEGGIVIATSAKNPEKAEELSAELEKSVQEDVENNGDTVQIEVLSVGEQRVQEARKLGVTPGKLNLVEKLKASSADPESINLEEWLNKPVREIMKATKENKKVENKPEDKKQETSSKDETSSAEQKENKEQKTVKVEEKVQSKEQHSNNGQNAQNSISKDEASSQEQKNQNSNQNNAPANEEKANGNSNANKNAAQNNGQKGR